MKIKFLKTLSTVFAIVIVASTAVFSASAASTSASVTLTASDKVAYSSTISTTATKATVYNASSSKHKVYGSIEYKSGDKYVEDAKVLVSKGDTDTIKSASKFSSNFKWRLELNPYGVATKNCTAEGTIKSR